MSNPYYNFLVESEATTYADGQFYPLKFNELENIGNISCTGTRIPLSNGRHFFLLVTSIITRQQLDKTLDNTGSFISNSYEELYESDYPLKAEIFTSQGQRRCLDGTWQHVCTAISNFVPGDKITPNTVHPPVLFLGSIATPQKLWANVASKLETISYAEDNIDGNTRIFPCNGLGVIGNNGQVVTVNNVTWRPSFQYGMNHPLITTPYAQNFNEGTIPFTGAFEITLPENYRSLSGTQLLAVNNEASSILQRILAGITLLTPLKPNILADVFYVNGQIASGTINPVNNLSLLGGFHTNVSQIPAEDLEWIMKLATAQNPTTKAEKAHITSVLLRCLDAIAHIKLSWDLRVGYILLWAAIESLATQSNTEGLTTNIALTILGAKGPAPENPDMFVKIKNAYHLRSQLVHNFESPNDEIILEHARTSLDGLKILFKSMLSRLQSGDENAKNFAPDMVRRALATS
ncbi:MAG: hypothetical protein DI628_00500 [Blastochloris viridis]|uniref:Uncharacterized protein n=1 Tax=Blastochloris viridis TaxID=1079 RepID=A0A6N4R1G6_BLAVI|nr:MAG: hypothetical protein DI628_00500 [Blastochloris viridis]